MFELADKLKCPYVATGTMLALSRMTVGWLYRASPAARSELFLYRIPKIGWSGFIFPWVTKPKRSTIAPQHPILWRDKRQSGYLFSRPRKLRDFLNQHGLEEQEGAFVNRAGEPIGTHQGSWRYTVGQRRHLGQAFGAA